jgi:hypothetical protein
MDDKPWIIEFQRYLSRDDHMTKAVDSLMSAFKKAVAQGIVPLEINQDGSRVATIIATDINADDKRGVGFVVTDETYKVGPFITAIDDLDAAPDFAYARDEYLELVLYVTREMEGYLEDQSRITIPHVGQYEIN